MSGDFSVYGGLYRPVHLIVTGEENFTLTDHGSPGVAWLQTSVTKKQAVLDVTAQISNGTRRKQPLTLVASVFDAGGKLVAKSEQPIPLAANVHRAVFVARGGAQPASVERAQRPVSLPGGRGIAFGERRGGFGRAAAGPAVLFGGSRTRDFS